MREPLEEVLSRVDESKSALHAISDNPGSANTASGSLFRAANDKLGFTLEQRRFVGGSTPLSAVSIAEAVQYQSIPRRS